MRISDWSSDVCSSDLRQIAGTCLVGRFPLLALCVLHYRPYPRRRRRKLVASPRVERTRLRPRARMGTAAPSGLTPASCVRVRSEEHTSELQSLMRTSYAVFCLKKTTRTNHKT